MALTVREVGFLLQRSEMKVRGMIGRGLLTCVGQWQTADGRQRRRIDPESVKANFPHDGSYRLRRLAMGAILSGRFVVPAPLDRWGDPAPLTAVVDVLASGGAKAWVPSGLQQVIEHQSPELPQMSG